MGWFDSWEDDRWSSIQQFRILWVITVIMLWFFFITQTTYSLAYLVMGTIAGFSYWIRSINKKGALASSLGFGTRKIIIIALAIGVIFGLVFTTQAFFSMAPLQTTQESTLIQQFFQNLGLNLSLETSSFWVNVLYQVITASFIEEVFFRGFLVPTIAFLFKNTRLGVIVGNGFFGLFHLYVYHANPLQVAFAIFFGIVMTIVNYKTKSIVPGIIAHAINNAIFGGFFKVKLA